MKSAAASQTIFSLYIALFWSGLQLVLSQFVCFTFNCSLTLFVLRHYSILSVRIVCFDNQNKFDISHNPFYIYTFMRVRNEESTKPRRKALPPFHFSIAKRISIYEIYVNCVKKH